MLTFPISSVSCARARLAPPAKLAFELLILTATRTSEMLKAQWGEIDGEIWTIPGHRMKAKQEHRIPLTKRCLDILEEARPFSVRRFYSPRSQYRNIAVEHIAAGNVLSASAKRLQHTGFARPSKIWATECTSFPLEVSEFALSHTVKDKTERAYRRGDLFAKRRQLMETWESLRAIGCCPAMTDIAYCHWQKLRRAHRSTPWHRGCWLSGLSLANFFVAPAWAPKVRSCRRCPGQAHQ